MQLINRTPFAGAVFVDVDRFGVETLVLAIKATYEIGSGEEPRLSHQQQPVSFEDRYAGEPGSSSLLYESDANWGRQATDVALAAYAYPTRDGDRETDVWFRVGPAVKVAHVFGDRIWTGTVGQCRPSSPRPFERIPMIYERAFGGTDTSPERSADHGNEPFNPVGRGFRAATSRQSLQSSPLPNIEDPQDLIQRPDDRPAPVGFTFVPKEWKPRTDYAGTYDASWQATRMPLLPDDFDPRFYTAASTGLSVPFLAGGEIVDLGNLSLSRREQFVIPSREITASFHVDAAPTPIRVRLDSVLVDAVNMKLVLAWHGSHPVQGLVDDIRWVLAEGGFGA
jgi:hypothetical protein